MWKINPEHLCKNHLLGEHFEIHKAVGNLKHSGTWTKSLTIKGFLEPQNFKKRHGELVKEMKQRGYSHNDKIKIPNFKIKGKVDIQKSIRDLKKRCKKCRKKLRSGSNGH